MSGPHTQIVPGISLTSSRISGAGAAVPSIFCFVYAYTKQKTQKDANRPTGVEISGVTIACGGTGVGF